MVFTAQFACADEGLNTEQNHDPLTSVVEGNTRFAIDMYKVLASEGDGNLFFAPYSVSSAMAMTAAGAVGDTEKEIFDALRLPSYSEDLHTCFSELVNILHRPSSSKVVSANALWSQEGMHILPSFVETTQQYYRAHVDTLDFIRNKKYAVATINGWVAENTNDKILDILTEQDVSDSTRLVLVNALYFKGSWQHPFRAENTIEDPFYVSTEVTTMAEMMNQTTKIPYHKGEGYSVVALPYQEESSEIPGYAMVIIVPDDYNGITAVEENLDIETVMNDYASLEPTKVQLSMPKFSMRKKVLLNEVLQQMGMVTPFTGDADFSDINGFGDLSISKVIHETFIDVDEEGTEAAAATAVTMNLTSVYSPEPAVVVRADHPFMAFIVDQATGSILFMGKVVNPKE